MSSDLAFLAACVRSRAKLLLWTGVAPIVLRRRGARVQRKRGGPASEVSAEYKAEAGRQWQE
jgi:hypothetical protein